MFILIVTLLTSALYYILFSVLPCVYRPYSNHLHYFYSGFVTVCLHTLGVAGEIDKDFKAKQLSMPPDSQMTALIFIRDKVDLVSLVAQFDVANADRATRHRRVIEALQVKANNTQCPFLTELASQKTAGEFSYYKSHCIDNVIYVKVKVSA